MYSEPRKYSSPPKRSNEITARDKQAADISMDDNMRLVFSLDIYTSEDEDSIRVSYLYIASLSSGADDVIITSLPVADTGSHTHWTWSAKHRICLNHEQGSVHTEKG